MKNVVKLDNYYSPEELKRALDEFVHHYNYHRYHESINNLTPSDVFFKRGTAIIKQREKIKLQTIKKRKEEYLKLKQKSTTQKINLTLN